MNKLYYNYIYKFFKNNMNIYILIINSTSEYIKTIQKDDKRESHYSDVPLKKMTYASARN